MERYLSSLRLFPGTESEYDRRHAAIWPDLADAIRSSGLRNVSGFRRGTDVWYYLEAHPDAETALGRFARLQVTADWIDSLRSVIADSAEMGGGVLRFDQIFHSDGPELGGPSERGLFAMVLDPMRVTEYDYLHAHPWPDMMKALADTGFRNYSGFRRGAQVIYYGEFHPDMATAFWTIGQTEVNARWGAAFEGIIATTTDADGNILAASETFHQD